MSDFAPEKTRKPGWRAVMFMGSAERRLTNPPCTSQLIERQCARATGSSGSRPACGKRSCRYSAIARASHTVTPACSSRGTRNDGESRSSSARVAGSPAGRTSSMKSSPAMRHSNHPRSDHDP